MTRDLVVEQHSTQNGLAPNCPYRGNAASNPVIHQRRCKLNGAKYFSTLDLRVSYHHIPLDKSLIPKIAFNSPFGKYEYIKVPFRLAQAPAYFQELMTGILKNFNFAIAYLGDIIIFSSTAEEHLSHIKKVFEKLQSAKLSMKLSKCNFFLQGNPIFRTHFEHQGHLSTTLKDRLFRRCTYLQPPNKFAHSSDW